MTSATIPNEAAVLEEMICQRFPTANVTIDAPSDPKGRWFLDIDLKGHVIAVQWKDDEGFGITTTPSRIGYGEGAHEVYRDSKSAFRRIVALLLGAVETAPPETVRLRELRLLMGMSQVELAEALDIQQAAVSRFENRQEKILLSSLRDFVAAMGCELQVMAKFPDGQVKQLQLGGEKTEVPVATSRNRVART